MADSPNAGGRFIWGTATASYQIEGAVREDGRGESIWDRFSHTPGKTHQGETGDVADDHYHRWREDVALMRDIGLNGYRFSIAWPRVVPTGHGTVNAAGLDFYDRLVDDLLANDIAPFATLFHWDLPQALQDAGGWPERATVDAFVAYVEAVVERLGDRVHHWMTHNEANVHAFLGHLLGQHAPGLTDPIAAYQTAHHLLLSHGLAAQAIHARDGRAQVGMAINIIPPYPASPSEADAAAAARYDLYWNRWFLDPMYRGQYPAEMLDLLGPLAPRVAEGDMAAIAAPTDFLGVNYYFRAVVRDNPEVAPHRFELVREEGRERTAFDWEVYPEGLTETLLRVTRDYGVGSLYITENGAAYDDALVADGSVHDAGRVSYLERHVAAARAAMEQGAPLHGYFIWSLLDNFEWAEGYSKRFGITYVDYSTQRRVLKDSGRWLRDYIATHDRP